MWAVVEIVRNKGVGAQLHSWGQAGRETGSNDCADGKVLEQSVGHRCSCGRGFPVGMYVIVGPVRCNVMGVRGLDAMILGSGSVRNLHQVWVVNAPWLLRDSTGCGLRGLRISDLEGPISVRAVSGALWE